MPVEVGEVDVVTRPPEPAAARSEPPAAPAGPPPAAELERALALQQARDLRLCAD